MYNRDLIDYQQPHRVSSLKETKRVLYIGIAIIILSILGIFALIYFSITIDSNLSSFILPIALIMLYLIGIVISIKLKLNCIWCRKEMERKDRLNAIDKRCKPND